jgi:CoA:oxalate CoA-transferase
VLTEVEVVNDPNAKAREMIAELDHPLGFKYRTVAPPLKFSESQGRVERSPPLLGQHTEDILTSLLGYSREDVARLVEEKVITPPPKMG